MDRSTMHRRLRSAAIPVVALATLLAALGACRSKKPEKKWIAFEAPSAPTKTDIQGVPGVPKVTYTSMDAGPLAKAVPVPAASIEAALNPSGLPVYAGPVGTVEGVVKVRGPKAPEVRVEAKPECVDAKSFYGRLFREGEGRTLADALVAVTGYNGYLPTRGDVAAVSIVGCSYDRRTYGVTYGQRLEVHNQNGRLTFVPDLVGAEMPAQMVAMPRGDAVLLYPPKPGYYELRDQMARAYMTAGVYVLKFPTHAVTGTDGRFRITGVPVGTVKLSALHPALGDPVERPLDVKEGQTTTAELELVYRPKPAEAPRQDRPSIR
jgi:hypothetical protein